MTIYVYTYKLLNNKLVMPYASTAKIGNFIFVLVVCGGQKTGAVGTRLLEDDMLVRSDLAPVRSCDKHMTSM